MEPIAAAYHWPPDAMLDLTLDDLALWHQLAQARLTATMHGSAMATASIVARMFGAK